MQFLGCLKRVRQVPRDILDIILSHGNDGGLLCCLSCDAVVRVKLTDSNISNLRFGETHCIPRTPPPPITPCFCCLFLVNYIMQRDIFVNVLSVLAVRVRG